MSAAERPVVELRLGAGDDGLAELVFADPDRAVNVLSTPAIDALESALDDLGHASGVTGLLVASGKDGSFIAGADLEEIARVEEASVAIGHASRVQSLFTRIEKLPFPVVAAIHGACLGGGLELALACHLRVASDDPRTRLGLPEVKLGLIPGFGGTQRLPRLVGVRRATEMILKGYALSAGDARRAGLVDAVLPAAGFAAAARTWARSPGARRGGRRASLTDRVLDVVGPARDLYFHLAERTVKRETRGNYPAPERAIAALHEGLSASLDEGLDVEAGLVGALAVSPECKALVRIFFLGENLKKDPGADLAAARPVTKLGVIGAGVMGASIAALAAGQDIPVRLRDVEVSVLLRGMSTVDRALRSEARRRRLEPRQADRWLRLVSPAVEPTGFRQASVVIEAVVEDLALKRDVLEEIDERLSPEAIFASNTSALSISELARSSRFPGRVVGMHFFNPVARMPLVEVVRGDATSAAAVATVVELARRLGKVPIVVADGPGFLVNRVLAPYLMEALLLVSEGVDPAAIEQAMADFGMPMGPLALLDEVGLDVARHVGQTLEAAFPERMQRSPLLEAMVAEKRIGKKVGVGFYRHGNKRPSLDPGLGRVLRRMGVRPRRAEQSRGGIQERLVLAMLNEVTRALEEGIVRTPGEADLAMVLGTGFPAFRGGLLAFGSAVGVETVVRSLERLESAHGERFRPSPLILALEREGKSFLEARQLLTRLS